MTRKQFLLLAMFFSVAAAKSFAAAQATGWQVKLPSTPAATTASVNTNASFYARLPAVFIDDLTANQKTAAVKLTKAEQHQAEVWGLTSREEARYVFLMQNKSGTYYAGKNLTPVEILGINARSNNERDFYALLDAKQTAERIAKELAFVAGYHEAYQRLMQSYQLPVLRPFNVSRFQTSAANPLRLQQGDVAMLFVSPLQATAPLVQEALKSVLEIQQTQLNIFFIGEHVTNTAVQDWANNQGLPHTLVANKTITLNIGSAMWANLKGEYTLPALFIVHNGKTRAYAPTGGAA